jgi:acyl-CoA reductase-like NAD-dependent aldehyde dehydrogenase
MRLESINAATGEQLSAFDFWNDATLENALESAAEASRAWRSRSVGERAEYVGALAGHLRERSDELARLASLEMGKPVREARAEVEKSAWACEYYAEHAEAMLHAEPVGTDASRS